MGVGGRVEVADGMMVSEAEGVEVIPFVLECPGGVPPVDTNGSYVGKVTGVSTAGAHETRNEASRIANMFLINDMGVILPKDDPEPKRDAVFSVSSHTLYIQFRIEIRTP